MNQIIHVAAAAIVNENNEVLLSQRLEGTHLAGLWEFPGGKLEDGETVEQALHRELKEEIGITPTHCRPLIQVQHDYVEKSVLLDVWRVDDYEGDVAGLEGQAVRWQNIDRLDTDEMPAADVPVVRALNLPSSYMISGKFETVQEFEQRLLNAIENGIRLVQVRLTHEQLEFHGEASLRKVIAISQALRDKTTMQLMYNVPLTLQPAVVNEALHLNSHELEALDAITDNRLWSASCHSVEQLNKAQEMGADFVVLSPVQFTKTHPETVPLGWEKFSSMIETVNLPVYALGGVGQLELERSWYAGAQGVAGIGAFWNDKNK